MIFETIHNCTIVGDSLVAFERSLRLYRIIDGKFVKAKGNFFETIPLQMKLAYNKLTQPSIDAAALVLRPNSKNYAHWLIECLPILYHLNENRITYPVIIPPTITRQKHPYIYESMACYKNLIFKQLDSLALNIRSAFYIPAAVNLARTDYVGRNARFLAEALKPEGDAGARRLYVSRSGRRRVTNEEELARFLDRFGFRVVDFAGMSLADQISICAGAELMVAPHGAGMANSLFMKEGATVVEIDYPKPTPQDKYFFELSNLTGKNHYFIRGRREDYRSELDRNENYTVDIRELEYLFAGLRIKP